MTERLQLHEVRSGEWSVWKRAENGTRTRYVRIGTVLLDGQGVGWLARRNGETICRGNMDDCIATLRRDAPTLVDEEREMIDERYGTPADWSNG